jgi:beta-mannosidase
LVARWPRAAILHNLDLRVGALSERRRIGLRTIELVTEPDEHGLSFGLRVNGRAVFAKGSNWIPADALAGRITEEKTRDLLQSAVDANHNMIRVWGGGRYEPDSFYDACDELGLLVWQDFMFSCNLYPSTPEFLREVDAEVRENVVRLHHHASIALWCGDNELIGALTWFPESRNDRDRYLVSYDRLNRTIEAALKETDPPPTGGPPRQALGP